VTQTRTALLRLLHCGETFTSITGEAALRLALLVVFQGGGVAKKCASSERRGLVIRPRCSDEEAETSRWIKAGVAGGGWERVDGEYKVDVGWLSVVQAKRGCPVMVAVQRMGGRGEEVDRRRKWWNNFQTASRRSLGGRLAV
jgi:hypothetical protein